MERIDISDKTQVSPEPRGYSDKYWIKNRLVKYNCKTYPDADLMESISAEILKLLNINTVNVGLGINYNFKLYKFDSEKCCIVDNFLTNEGDVTYDLSTEWVTNVSNNVDKCIRNSFYKMFQKFNNPLMAISDEEILEVQKNYIRMILGDCIINNEDRRIKNVCLIYNENNLSYRLAPSFDNALAFHSFLLQNQVPVCCIGEQYFEVKDVIRYIINTYYKDVVDILENLDICTNKLDFLLDKYKEEISEEKLLFIYQYIIDINRIIKEIEINKENEKRI